MFRTGIFSVGLGAISVLKLWTQGRQNRNPTPDNCRDRNQTNLSQKLSESYVLSSLGVDEIPVLNELYNLVGSNKIRLRIIFTVTVVSMPIIQRPCPPPLSFISFRRIAKDLSDIVKAARIRIILESDFKSPSNREVPHRWKK